MRKKLALLLALCVVAGTVSMPVGVQEVKAVEVGQGMEEGVAALTAGEVPEGYTPIYDIADLYAIRNAPKENYILMNDIDMSEDTSPGGDYDCGTGWDSIEEFSGTLDGNGHRIIGMHIFGEFDVVSYADKAIGLFETTSYATIKNLGVVDCNIDVNINVTNGNFAGFSGSSGIGTMVGVAEFGDLNNCFSSGSIRYQITNSSGNYYEVYAGGIIGYTNRRVENCYNICEIAYTTDTNTIRETDIDIGGICGHCCGRIVKCYNAGIIKENEHGQVGAICGYQLYGYENCSYLKGTASRGMGNEEDTSDCVSLTAAQMKSAKVFTGFDFTDTWEIDPYCSYQYPQLKNNRMIKINSIELKAQPQKLIYNQGEALNLDGAAMGITYEDGITTMIPLTKDMLSGYDMDKIGIQTVTVTYGGRQTSFGIEVKEIPVSSIGIPKELSLYRSEEQRLNVTIIPANASDKTISWESDNPAVASVDNNGVVKAKSRGTAVITATSANGLQAKCTVTVLVSAVSIQLSRTSLVLTKGNSSAITAQLLPMESTDAIKWSSSNQAVAEVYDGTIIAKKAGNAVIKAYTESGLEAKCTVTVKTSENDAPGTIKVDKVKLNQSKITLGVNEKFALNATITPQNASNKKVTWVSSNPRVVSVNTSTGKVMAKKKGAAVITATADGRKSSCKVTVKAAPKTISLNKKIVTLKKGKTFKIKVNLPANTASNKITYKSNNRKVASVDAKGKITAKKKGKASITVTAYNGKRAKIQVIVK